MIAGLALAVALAVSGFLFARRALLLTRLVRMGHAPGIERRDDVPERLRSEAVVVLGQRKLLQRLVPGLMHAFIFWAFIVLFPAIPLAMIAIVDEDAAPHWAGYEALANVFACSRWSAWPSRSSSARSCGRGASRAATSARPTSSWPGSRASWRRCWRTTSRTRSPSRGRTCC